VPGTLARQHSCVPVLIDGNELLVASPNPLDPNVEEELRLRFNMPVRSVLCTPANVTDVITKFVPRDGSFVEPAPVAAAPAAAAKPGQAAPAPAKAPRRTGPLSPEDQKQRRDYAIVAFNLTVMILMGIMWQALGRGFWASAVIALPIAAVAAGITWKVKS
jgi:type II secretion system (T2SS) protein E